MALKLIDRLLSLSNFYVHCDNIEMASDYVTNHVNAMVVFVIQRLCFVIRVGSGET